MEDDTSEREHHLTSSSHPPSFLVSFIPSRPLPLLRPAVYAYFYPVRGDKAWMKEAAKKGLNESRKGKVKLGLIKWLSSRIRCIMLVVSMT